jgi:pentatricopeptide repeat protein
LITATLLSAGELGTSALARRLKPLPPATGASLLSAAVRSGQHAAAQRLLSSLRPGDAAASASGAALTGLDMSMNEYLLLLHRAFILALPPALPLRTAFDSFAQLKKTAPGLPDVSVYNALLKHCVEDRRDIKSAFEVFDMLKRDAIPPDAETYGVLTGGCMSGGLVRAGGALFEEMVNRSGIPPSAIDFGSFVRACAGAGACDMALRALSMMRDSGGGRGAPAAYSAVVSMLCNQGETDRALEVFRTIRDPVVCPDGYALIIVGVFFFVFCFFFVFFCAFVWSFPVHHHPSLNNLHISSFCFIFISSILFQPCDRR